MTHFATLVLVPNDGSNSLEGLLAPYCENDEWFRDGSRWDWYQVGGRFTGLLTNYDPATNPNNFEPCEYCEATGTTTQAVADKFPAHEKHVGTQCIQCSGSGKRMKWSLEEYEGDSIPTPTVKLDAMPWVPGSIVTPDGVWHEQNIGGYGWFGATRTDEEVPEDLWKHGVQKLLDMFPDSTTVIVDCHV